jgi:hypothetical protein
MMSLRQAVAGLLAAPDSTMVAVDGACPNELHGAVHRVAYSPPEMIRMPR